MAFLPGSLHTLALMQRSPGRELREASIHHPARTQTLKLIALKEPNPVYNHWVSVDADPAPVEPGDDCNPQWQPCERPQSRRATPRARSPDYKPHNLCTHVTASLFPKCSLLENATIELFKMLIIYSK